MGNPNKDRGLEMRAPCASDPSRSRGRRVREAESAFRSPFQRDRDRIVHSSAFRRLQYKTQVFVEHEGDCFRTRLTHSLEVAQVARTIGRALHLDEDLTEAVALAHDLGHPPFGHAGEDALAALMAPHGGFDHNAQAIRIVTHLERHYADFDGLNLTWDVLDGLAKHNGPVAHPRPRALAEYGGGNDLELDSHASAEAQVAAIADDIAYNHHDLHDGLRARLFAIDDLARLPILDACLAEVDAAHGSLDRGRRQHEALRRFFGVLVADVLATSRANLAELAPASAADIRAAGRPMVRFSESAVSDLSEIRAFLFERMYRAPPVVRMRDEATAVVRGLFPFLLAHPEKLPTDWRSDIARAADETARARLVSDYIAGMTDRFALQCHAYWIERRPPARGRST